MNRDTVDEFARNLDELRKFVVTMDKALTRLRERRRLEREDELRFVVHDLLPMLGEEASERLLGNTSSLTAEMPTDLANADEIRHRMEHEFDAKLVVTRDDNQPGRVVIRAEGNGSRRLMEQVHKSFRALSALQRFERQRVLLLRGALITLTSLAERFVSDLFQQHCRRFPAAYGADERLLSLADLQRAGSIEDAIQEVVDYRVNQIMYGGFEDWLRKLKGTVGLSLAYIDEHIGEIIEVFQRRHLLVHNDGVVNAQYLSKVPGDLLEPGTSKGETLDVSLSYVVGAIDVLEVNLTLMAAELWQKIDFKDSGRSHLLDITFRHLVDKRWHVAEALYGFIKDDLGLDDRTRKIALINYWQAIKWQGRYEEIRESLEREDFSASTKDFQLAVFALRNDIKGFFELLPSVIDVGLSIAALKEWPLFREIRESQEYSDFIAAYEATHEGSITLPLDDTSDTGVD